MLVSPQGDLGNPIRIGAGSGLFGFFQRDFLTLRRMSGIHEEKLVATRMGTDCVATSNDFTIRKY